MIYLGYFRLCTTLLLLLVVGCCLLFVVCCLLLLFFFKKKKHKKRKETKTQCGGPMEKPTKTKYNKQTVVEFACILGLGYLFSCNGDMC